ncbi:ABC transporter substrate-binding protein [bacterium]|nr:ABC transporter substrate-binding protein [bacterium]
MSRRAAALACLMLGAATAAAAPIAVAVSVPPQAALVEAVGGDRVAVVTAVPPGESPHAFDPTPTQVARLATCRLYVATGVEVEIQLLPRLEAVAADLTVVGPVAHAHGGHDHDHHHHDHPDPHIWLDPLQAAEQVRTVGRMLARLDPAGEAGYQQREAATVERLEALHAELEMILAPVRGRDLVVAHPAFGHLAAAYGLHQIAIEHEGHQPSPRQLARVIERVRDRGASNLFVQPQFPLAAARSLARAADVELVVLDPLARDYFDNMRSMSRTIAQALTPATGS